MKNAGQIAVMLFFMFMCAASSLFSCAYDYDYSGEAWNDLSLTEYSVVNQPLFLRFYPHYQVHGGDNTKYTLGLESQLKKNANIGDWNKYFAGSLSTAQIDSLIYGNETATRNLVLKPEVREYTAFSRKIEPYVANGWVDYWDDSRRPDKKECKTLMNEAVLSAEKSVDPFLKSRYGFQAMRLASQMDDYKTCLEIFNKYLLGKATGTFVSYWALCYAARAEWKTGRKDKALEKYLLIFDQSAPLQWIAISSIKSLQLNENDWTTCIAGMQNNYKKEVLWFARELSSGRPDDTEALKNIVSLMPKMAHSEVVLMRKILLIEAEYLHSFDDSDPASQPKNRDIPLKMSMFCEKVAKETPDLRTPAYWYASAGYLAYLGKDFNRASAMFSIAKSIKTENAQLLKQIEIWEYALRLAVSGKNFDVEAQKSTLQQIGWTSTLTNARNNRAVHPTLMRLVAHKFRLADDKPRSAASLFSIDFDSPAFNIFHDEASDEEFQRAIQFVAKKEEVLDPYLLQKFRYSTADLSFMRGWRAMDRQQFTSAYDIFKSLPGSYIDKNDYYPSKIPVMKDLPSCFFKPTEKEKPFYGWRSSNFHNQYTSMYKDISVTEFAKLAIDLKKQIASPDPGIHSAAAYTYAVIFYRLPYPYFPLVFADQGGDRKDLGYLDVVLKNCKDAIETSQANEILFKSLVVYMLAAKDKMNLSYSSKEKEYESYVEYVKKNARRILAEPYFKEYAEYCPLFKSFE